VTQASGMRLGTQPGNSWDIGRCAHEAAMARDGGPIMYQGHGRVDLGSVASSRPDDDHPNRRTLPAPARPSNFHKQTDVNWIRREVPAASRYS
jgi:hypothetical protein